MGERKRAIGMNCGQRGDLVLSSVTARAFKAQYPDYHLTLGVGPQYADMLPLFYQHPYFDSFHVYTTYEGWPGKADVAYLSRTKYDLVFNAMPKVPHDWFTRWHQTEAMAHAHGLAPSQDKACVLTKWFEPLVQLPNTIAFAPFGGFHPSRPVNDKMLSIAQAQLIVDRMKSELGYSVVCIGAPEEPHLEGTNQFKGCYFDSVRMMLGCKALIHTDTGMGWVASAYQFPCLGLYANSYYGAQHVKSIQPVNPNSIYLDAPTIGELSLNRVTEAIKTLLS